MLTVASYIRSMKSLTTVRKKYFTVREYPLLFSYCTYSQLILYLQEETKVIYLYSYT